MTPFEITSMVQNGVEVLKIGGVVVPAWLVRNTLVALSKGVGDLALSLLDVPKAKLEAIAAQIRSEGAARVTVTRALAAGAAQLATSDEDLAKRALSYYSAQALQAQNNREVVAKLFVDLLKSPPINSGKAEVGMDEDWLTVFWRLAESKSTHAVQETLAHLLAQETAAPGSVSVSTLHVLSLMTAELARLFERFCCLSIDDGTNVFVIHPHVMVFQQIGPLDAYGISYEDLFELEGLGVIRSAEALRLNFVSSGPERIDYGGSPAIWNANDKQLDFIYFTRAGRELRRLMALSRNPTHSDALQKKMGDAFIPNPNAL